MAKAQDKTDAVAEAKDNLAKIQELKQEAPREGMTGISPRYIQDKLSNALVSNTSSTSGTTATTGDPADGRTRP